MSAIIMYSKSIQTELIESYNKGIAFLSSHTISKANLTGF